jgi:pectate lyase
MRTPLRLLDSSLLAMLGLGVLAGCSDSAPALRDAVWSPLAESPRGGGDVASSAEPTPPTGVASGGAASPEGPPDVGALAGTEAGTETGSTSTPAATTSEMPLSPCEPAAACTLLPAFPGADGAGGYVTGGRGGDVYHVTRLDTDSSDLTAGTLRFGLSNLTAPRTIVFDVSGVFSLGRSRVEGWDDNGNGWDSTSRLNIPSNVTIAGQTAPGPVIISGGLLKGGGNNFILRNVTIAPGFGSRGFDEPELAPVVDDFPDSYVFDAIDITGTDLIIDHVTTVFATDETISMNESVDNATVQYSSISLGQNYPQADAETTGVRYTGHALGSLLQAGSNANISVHHNLYAHQKGRLPRVGTEADALTLPGVGAFNDFRNNVFYNWLNTAGTGASGQASQNNFIANFYVRGPGGDDASGAASTAIVTAAGGSSIFDGSDPVNTRVHHAGNVKDLTVDADALDVAPLTDADFVGSRIEPAAFVETRYDGVTDSADVALQRVLDYAGSMWWSRGALDQRIAADVRAGTGKIQAWADNPFDPSEAEGVEWRALVNTPTTTRAEGFDTDRDGMPDSWELEHGLDPGAADNNGDFDTDGYTNLEEYINEIAAWPASTPALFSGRRGPRYAQIQNWRLLSGSTLASMAAAPWQPSRHDVAWIAAGTAIVDAVGQHAGALHVASLGSSSTASAHLHVASGWLDVAGVLSVGTAPATRHSGGEPGAGHVSQSGGHVRARAAVVLGGPAGALGEYHLEGGVLGTARLLRTPAGRFHFNGGTLRADRIDFDLVNEGGVLAPGSLDASGVESSAPARARHLSVAGDLSLRRGVLQVRVERGSSDTVDVGGGVQLGGALEIEPLSGAAPENGDSWVVLTARGSIRGRFERVPSGYRVEVSGPRVILSYGWGPLAERVSPASAVLVGSP